jgi:hypothetical protein
MQLSLLLKLAVSWGAQILVQSIATNIRFYLSHLKMELDMVFFILQMCFAFNSHSICCMSKDSGGEF